MEEREFFNETTEQRTHTLTCPKCGQAAEYKVTWVVRRKRAQLPRGADERDRARFAKAQSYMVRRDDKLVLRQYALPQAIRDYAVAVAGVSERSRLVAVFRPSADACDRCLKIPFPLIRTPSEAGVHSRVSSRRSHAHSILVFRFAAQLLCSASAGLSWALPAHGQQAPIQLPKPQIDRRHAADAGARPAPDHARFP